MARPLAFVTKTDASKLKTEAFISFGHSLPKYLTSLCWLKNLAERRNGRSFNKTKSQLKVRQVVINYVVQKNNAAHWSISSPKRFWIGQKNTVPVRLELTTPRLTAECYKPSKLRNQLERKSGNPYKFMRYQTDKARLRSDFWCVKISRNIRKMLCRAREILRIDIVNSSKSHHLLCGGFPTWLAVLIETCSTAN